MYSSLYLVIDFLRLAVYETAQKKARESQRTHRPHRLGPPTKATPAHVIATRADGRQASTAQVSRRTAPPARGSCRPHGGATRPAPPPRGRLPSGAPPGGGPPTPAKR